jgi:hypothetical protein
MEPSQPPFPFDQPCLVALNALSPDGDGDDDIVVGLPHADE